MITNDNAWSVVDISALDSESKVTYYEVPAYTAYEIDEPVDWIIVEELLKAHS